MQEGPHDVEAVMAQLEGVFLEKLQQFTALVVGARNEHLKSSVMFGDKSITCASNLNVVT
jgi:hypothetical protein